MSVHQKYLSLRVIFIIRGCYPVDHLAASFAFPASFLWRISMWRTVEVSFFTILFHNPLSKRLKPTLCYMLCASQKIQNGTSENIFTVRDISTVRTRSEKCCQIWYLISNQSALQSTILLWIHNDVQYVFQKPAAPRGIQMFSVPCAVPYTVKKGYRFSRPQPGCQTITCRK